MDNLRRLKLPRPSILVHIHSEHNHINLFVRGKPQT
jgi:hypothetical protein